MYIVYEREDAVDLKLISMKSNAGVDVWQLISERKSVSNLCDGEVIHITHSILTNTD